MNFRSRTQWQHKSWSRIKSSKEVIGVTYLCENSGLQFRETLIYGEDSQQQSIRFAIYIAQVDVDATKFVHRKRISMCFLNNFPGQFWIIFDAKSGHLGVSKAVGQMLRNKKPKLIENEVVNAKKVPRLGALSEQKWVWAWVLKFSVFQRPSWSRQNSIWTTFLVSEWGPETVLQSVFFRVPTDY